MSSTKRAYGWAIGAPPIEVWFDFRVKMTCIVMMKRTTFSLKLGNQLSLRAAHRVIR